MIDEEQAAVLPAAAAGLKVPQAWLSPVQTLLPGTGCMLSTECLTIMPVLRSKAYLKMTVYVCW